MSDLLLLNLLNTDWNSGQDSIHFWIGRDISTKGRFGGSPVVSLRPLQISLNGWCSAGPSETLIYEFSDIRVCQQIKFAGVVDIIIGYDGFETLLPMWIS